MMDNIGRRGSGRQKSDHHTKISDSSWSMVHQHQLREQNAMNINKKILNIIAERDAALDERDRALLEKKKAMEERDAAISQKNMAIRERNDAMLDRDNAIEALRNAMNHRLGFGGGGRGIKRATYHQSPRDAQVVNDFKREIAVYEGNNSNHLSKRAKGNEPRSPSSVAHKPKKEKILSEDLNKRAGCEGFKLRNNWDAKDLGLNIVYFDETTMPLPGCSCTGEFKNCYKWGNGGWQSSCCTTTLSCYPLPPMPNKRYARMAGRKMSGSVFTRLLSRLASEGYDLSVPVDLKDHWSKHGTNRYITIK